MSRILYFLIIFSAIAGLSLSCKHELPAGDNTNPVDTTGNGTATIPCNGDTVYFSNTILPILTQYCAMSGCHNAASRADGVQLTDFNSIINTADVRAGDPGGSDLYEVLVTTDPSKKMPPSGSTPIPDSLVSLIRKWIVQGAKNNYCTPDCDTSQFGYQSVVSKIISSKCIGCHSATNQQGGISLDTYDKVKELCNNGRLTNAISYTSIVKMPPNQKMRDCDINLILKWKANNYPQ
jgi:uncharacterized membrane protein